MPNHFLNTKNSILYLGAIDSIAKVQNLEGKLTVIRIHTIGGLSESVNFDTEEECEKHYRKYTDLLRAFQNKNQP